MSGLLHPSDAGIGSGLTVPARAKINLALHVTGRREDGYHLLDSLVVFADIADRISVASADTLSLRVTGPFGAALAGDPQADNLVLRAARALGAASEMAAGASIVLEKNLPVASGIGGGSADAAATLLALQRLWRVRPAPAALAEIALALGADVPVCLAGRACRMRGIGEILDPVPDLPPGWIVLANAGLPVATPAVFRARAPGVSPALALPGRFADLPALAAWLERHTVNDLEAAAVAICPPIAEVLAGLAAAPGCRLARMSGSGGTCFALHDDAGSAAASAERLSAQGWWARSGRLGSASSGGDPD